VLKLPSSHAILATARPSYLVLALVALNLMLALRQAGNWGYG